MTSSQNKLQSFDWCKAFGKPEIRKKSSKIVYHAKSPKTLNVIVSHPKVSASMKSCKCSECGKSFKVKTALMKHLKIHKKERPSKCLTCGKNFSKKSSLMIHQRSHNEGKSFKCNECEKMFGQRSNLLVHSKTHIPKKSSNSKNISCVSKHPKHDNFEDKKPYRCMKCNKTFVLHKNLIKHQEIHATEISLSPETACRNAEQSRRAEEKVPDHSGLMLEELRKMRENVDMLLLNQQSQLQVLQEIQKQLGVLLLGNDLMNSNVYRLGLFLGQQTAAMGSTSFPLLNLSNLLPDSAHPFSSQM
ncbi:zinc finger protein 184-like [Rhineura floridana]|uniref:zinc finger protein 184-like n=1 Tax=Rhineura floridana TaxID=261503 RepID=UPI002AC82F08|nr:zinc finger protein 184-like [Rhineura floridana]XP_061493897.1 zinc finger protein 184-like [Rhineura floridana]XP_061493898.1 zinc finger protein 184-like [Rhineura floridana]